MSVEEFKKSDSSTPKSGAVAGSGMDRIVKNPGKKWKKYGMIAGGAIAVLLVAWMLLGQEGGRTLRVSDQTITVSTVIRGQFDDFIPVRGRITPLSTVFLDAVEGGRVETIYVEDGANVNAGDLIVELSNTQLQLDVIAREAEVTEQLNNLRTLELALEQNRLEHRRNLVEIDYQITRLTRTAERQGPLAENGTIPMFQYEDTMDELNYYTRRREVTIESQQTDERLQRAQMEQLRLSAAQLEQNLQFARRNLDSLNVRAPIDGRLTAFNVEIGQSLGRGERIGQIDDPDNFKVTANIDEFYLTRVDLEQIGSVNVGGRDYELVITKIYPQVRNGQFEIDLEFVDGVAPDNIRRGQTMQIQLQLGDPTQALMIPNGAFFQDTGGAWVFVVAPDGSTAIRRDVRLGRRNLRYIEVLDGLEEGERVVTSPYTNYLDMDRLSLSEDG